MMAIAPWPTPSTSPSSGTHLDPAPVPDDPLRVREPLRIPDRASRGGRSAVWAAPGRNRIHGRSGTACGKQVVLVSDFYDHPDLYDALLPVKAEVPFYVDLARQQAGAVLELACGTGQLTIPVAGLGLPTVGLDQSRAMLNVARKRASAAGASVAFVQSDMRDFALGRELQSHLRGPQLAPAPAVDNGFAGCHDSGQTSSDSRRRSSHSTSSCPTSGCWPGPPASAFRSWR